MLQSSQLTRSRLSAACLKVKGTHQEMSNLPATLAERCGSQCSCHTECYPHGHEKSVCGLAAKGYKVAQCTI